MNWKPFVSILLGLSMGACASLPNGESGSKDVSITIRADEPGARISPTMGGAFFEDINFGGDGGLYAEMVKIRGFEFPEAMMGWIKISPSNSRGEVMAQTESPLERS